MFKTQSNNSPISADAEGAPAPGLPPKYKLRPFHRDVPDDTLLADLRQTARRLRASTLTQSAYRSAGKFEPLTLSGRFGGWNAALIKAGLQPSRHFRVSAQTVLDDVRRVTNLLQTRQLLLSDYQTHGKYSTPVVYRHFKTWSGLLHAAGLNPSTCHPKATDRALLQNIQQLWHQLGRQPKCTELHPPLSRFGLTPYQSHFGGWQNALIVFVKWANTQPQYPNTAPTKIKTHKTTRTISWRLRFLILRRDHFRCRTCGRSPATHPNIQLHIDHKTPWSRGGESTPENLQTLCQICNQGKSNL